VPGADISRLIMPIPVFCFKETVVVIEAEGGALGGGGGLCE
jgi:hypothetical protein